MSAFELDFATVHSLAPAVKSGRLSPVDIVAAALDRIERLEPKLQAFIAVYAEDARLAAEAAERDIRAGRHLGPLHGFPVVVKDLIDIEGRVTTGGSRGLGRPDLAHHVERADRRSGRAVMPFPNRWHLVGR